MRVLLVIAVLAACGKSEPRSSRLGDQKPDPWDKPVEVGSGSAVDDQPFADFADYAARSVLVVLAFDGDCNAQAERLLALEPTSKALTLRVMGMESVHVLGSTQASLEVQVKAALKPYEAEIASRVKDIFAAQHATPADLERKEAELTQKCANDPKFKAANARLIQPF